MIIGLAALVLALLFVGFQQIPNGKLRGMLSFVTRILGFESEETTTTGTDGSDKKKETVAAPTLLVTDGEDENDTGDRKGGDVKDGQFANGATTRGSSTPTINLAGQDGNKLDDSEDDDDDEAPAFPALNSAQRASGPSQPAQLGSVRNMSSPVPTFQLSSSTSAFSSMPPPPIPIRARNAAQQARAPPSSSPTSSLSSSLSSEGSGGSTPKQSSFMPLPSVPPQISTPSMAPPPVPRISPSVPSSSSSLMPPPSSAASARRQPPSSSSLTPQFNKNNLSVLSTGAAGVAAGTGLHLPNKPKSSSSSSRRKVILTPGHSPLDWARLQSSNTDLRTGVPPTSSLLKVTPSELKKHKSKEDAWTVIEDKVYSISAYLPFHPGGEKELMRVAGRDGTKLYMKTHPWVNYDNMLRGCLIGVYVPESSVAVGGGLEKSGGGGLEDMD